MHVIERTVAAAETGRGLDGASEIVHGARTIASSRSRCFGKADRNRRGIGAARAVRVRRIDARGTRMRRGLRV